MRISPSEEYGLRCILKLAASYPHELASVDAVSREEGLSAAYTEKLLLQLKKAGLVESSRGASGGYRLSRDPSEITLSSILKAFDGLISTDLCDRFTGDHEECVHLRECSIRPIFVVLAHHLYNILNQITLFDLMKEGEKRVRQEVYHKFPVKRECEVCKDVIAEFKV
jgi:Rrf2 family protein